MAIIYDVPTHKPNSVRSFLEALVADARENGRLADGGIVLRDADLEIVMGVYGASVFEDKSLVDDAALHFSTILYEFINYFEPDRRYHDAPIMPGTMLWRLIHEQGGTRRPLLSLNAVPIEFDGTWGEMIDAEPPSCPTLETMKLTAGQFICRGGERVRLDSLDVRELNVFEFTRLGSMMEMVMGRERDNPRPPDPVVEQFCRTASHYRSDASGFLTTMLRGRALVAMGTLAYMLITDNDLMFGHSGEKVLGRFVETIGMLPEMLQWLDFEGYRPDSHGYRMFKGHYDHHPMAPFILEFNNLMHDSMLNQCIEIWKAFQ